jgi:hypothetical protein
MATFDRADDLILQSPREILERLAKGQYSSDMQRPVVTIETVSGRFEGQVHGWLEQRHSHGSHEAYVQIRQQRSNGDRLVTVLNAAHLVAVTLVDFERCELALEAAGLLRSRVPSDQDCPSRLEVERRYAETSAVVRALGSPAELQLEWSASESSPLARHLAQSACDRLALCLRSIAGDAMGREALGGVRKILVRMTSGDGMEVKKTADGFEILLGAGAKEKDRERFLSELQRSVESVL